MHFHIREIGIPRDIDPAVEQRIHLCVVIGKQDEVHGDAVRREIVFDTFPDRDNFRIVRDDSDFDDIRHFDSPGKLE